MSGFPSPSEFPADSMLKSLFSAGKTSSGDIRSALTIAKGSFSSPATGKVISADPGKPRFIRSLFDRISRRYDLFNRVSSLGLDRSWRRKTIDSLSLRPGMSVLDLASGTGDLAQIAAARLAPLGLVAACDFSHEMLRSANARLSHSPAGYWHMRLAQGAAERLPFAPEAFDGATMGFALRNVSDLDATLREFHRVLKPGGRLALLELGRPRAWWMRIGHRLWLSTAVPVLGALTTGAIWPFLYLRRSILQFMAPEQVVIRLEAAGFRSVRSEPLSGGIVYLYTALK